MKIYVSHASSYDYTNELYLPVSEALDNNHELILPHSKHTEGFNTRDVIPTCDVILAEVSFPSTGQGIELGWADKANVPIICVYKRESKPSSAIRFIATGMDGYSDSNDLKRVILAQIDQLVRS